MAKNDGWGTIRVTGPRYKTGAWVRRQFLALLEHDDKITPEKMTAVPLQRIAESYADEWHDFCVLEGVTVRFS
jgi:hypothetical protein